jgi:hypothetical protein
MPLRVNCDCGDPACFGNFAPAAKPGGIGEAPCLVRKGALSRYKPTPAYQAGRDPHY